MKLSTWIKNTTTDQQRELARRAGCHSNYLYCVALNGCSAGLAKKIERVTTRMTPNKIVFRRDLRPDIWDKKEN